MRRSLKTMLMGLLLCQPVLVSAQEYRMKLNPPASQVYEAMFNFAGNGSFDGIGKSLVFVKEILDKIKARFNVNIEDEISKAITTKDYRVIVSSVRKLAYYDMRDIFAGISEDSGQSASVLLAEVKAGYADFLLLSGEIKKRDFKTYLQIDKEFNGALRVLTAGISYGGAQSKMSAQDIDKLKAHFSVISSGVQGVFAADFKA